MPRVFTRTCLSLALTLAVAAGGHAASHREAPLIALDPAADITDVYAFRSWEDPGKVLFIMNVIPGQEPSSGPNYFNFDDQVVYDINLDVDRDGKADDIIYRVRFKTELRPPFNDLPVAYAGVDGVPGLPPAIRDLDGPDAAGLGLRQTYTVTEIRGPRRLDLGTGLQVAVPSNIGPRTMPNYEDLAEQGIYHLSNGGRVFAGQRDETFYIDLGATFDTLNFRRTPPILNEALFIILATALRPRRASDRQVLAGEVGGVAVAAARARAGGVARTARCARARRSARRRSCRRRGGCESCARP